MSGEPPDVRRRRPPGLAEAGAPPRGEIGEPSSGASRALADGGLEALRRDTDAFLAVELPEGEGAQPTLRAVGSEEDLERIQSELRSFE